MKATGEYVSKVLWCTHTVRFCHIIANSLMICAKYELILSAAPIAHWRQITSVFAILLKSNLHSKLLFASLIYQSLLLFLFFSRRVISIVAVIVGNSPTLFFPFFSFILFCVLVFFSNGRRGRSPFRTENKKKTTLPTA